MVETMNVTEEWRLAWPPSKCGPRYGDPLSPALIMSRGGVQRSAHVATVSAYAAISGRALGRNAQIVRVRRDLSCQECGDRRIFS
jgi:hypothetical protein